MRIAVLDIGTNTFNLIVAENAMDGSFKILHNSKLPVKLGEKGITKGEISDEAFSRGLKAIRIHYKTLQNYYIDYTYAMGTSALRTSRNGPQFMQSVFEETGISVETIAGEKEAELIYFGVRQTHPMDQGKYLILDIGGGSNEFIIADKEKIYWKQSYEIGMARLLEQFRPSNPLKENELYDIRKYIDSKLQGLEAHLSKHNVNTLIGASGSFETFVSMIRAEHIADETSSPLFPQSVHIIPEEFNALYERLIWSTTEERRRMKGLEPMRIEMIVLACLFVKFILENFGLEHIYQSNFSMKEGVVYQIFKKI